MHQSMKAFILIVVSTQSCRSTLNIKDQISLFESDSSPDICEDLTNLKIGKKFDRDLAEKEIKKIEQLTTINFDNSVKHAKRRIADLESSNNPLPSDLDTLEIAMIISYSRESYVALNEALIKRNCDPVRVASRFLASGVNKSPGIRGILYRGAYVSSNELKSTYIPNTIIKSPAFLSTTFNFSVAKGFIKNALFAIENGNGGFIGDISRYGSEEEVILNPGTKLKVHRVEKKILKVEEVETEVIVIHLKQLTETPHNHFVQAPNSITPW